MSLNAYLINISCPIQTLVRLNLACNSIQDAGAEDLARALQHNTVGETSSTYPRSINLYVLAMQTLTILDLRSNKITSMGAADLAETLKSNTVGSLIYFFVLTLDQTDTFHIIS